MAKASPMMVTAAELAKELGVRPQTVLAWKRRRLITGTRVGKQVLFFPAVVRDELLRWSDFGKFNPGLEHSRRVLAQAGE